MKKWEKYWILGLIVLVIVVIIVVATKNKGEENKTNEVKEEFVEVLEDGTRLNTSEKLKKTKKIDGLEVSNFQVTEKNNVTVLLGTITNNTNETKGDYPVSIKILDKEGNEIVTVGGYIGEVKPGQSIQLNCSASFDYGNAYDFEITKK